MAPDGVSALIDGNVKNFETLKELAPDVTAWLKDGLTNAHTNSNRMAGLKKRLKLLLGCEFYVTNLEHLGVWDDLLKHCADQALELGKPMQAYFEEHNLGEVLGQAYPNLFGAFVRSGGAHTTASFAGEVRRPKVRHSHSPPLPMVVSPCGADASARRQDDALPLPFPRDPAKSQLWNEKCFIHCLRLIAIGIDDQFQKTVEAMVVGRKGAFKKTDIKGYGRMKNKCVSKNDHYHEQYPRPGLNIDVNRNCSTFDEPESLLDFIGDITAHSSFGGHPARSKNMFLFDRDRAEKQFFYRTVMINWLYTPGMTFAEMAAKAKAKWDRYYDFAYSPGFGSKDSSESWSDWRAQVRVALAYLTNEAMGSCLVQSIVETQLLLRPYLDGRAQMHLLYKLARAETPQALFNDFKTESSVEVRSYDAMQNDALKEIQRFLQRTDDVNLEQKELNGATRLWGVAEEGCVEAMCEILLNRHVDVNKASGRSKTTPLFIAAHHGHCEVVELLLGHDDIRVNDGALETGISPLYIAAQQGREDVVEILLRHKDIDVNQSATKTGATALCTAVLLEHEHIVEMLLRAKGVDVDHTLHDGSTARSIATLQGRENMAEILRVYFSRNSAWGENADSTVEPSFAPPANEVRAVEMLREEKITFETVKRVPKLQQIL